MAAAERTSPGGHKSGAVVFFCFFVFWGDLCLFFWFFVLFCFEKMLGKKKKKTVCLLIDLVDLQRFGCLLCCAVVMIV